MRKIVTCLFVCAAVVAFFCVAAYAQQENTEENIRKIESALDELAKEKNPTDADKKLCNNLEQSLKRLKDKKASLEKAKSELGELNKQAQQVLKEFNKKAFSLAENVVVEEDYTSAAKLLNEILETDPDKKEAQKLFEKIIPSIWPQMYLYRWYEYLRVKKLKKVGLTREGIGADLWYTTTAALRWLHFHQDKDGKWDQDGFDKNCDARSGPKCGGKGTSQYDVGVTGLALLAFMGSGHTHRVGDFNKTVNRGLDWLVSQQQKDGSFGPRLAESWIYNHAIATQAICEAYALTLDPKLKKPCEKAVDFILKAQNKGLGWKYKPGGNRGGTSITGWMALALQTAKTAGFKVPDSASKSALALFERMTGDKGKVGCRRSGGKGCDIRNRAESFEYLPSMTALTILCRILYGQKRSEENITRGVKLLMKNLPDWNKPKNDKVDMYYWFFGTYAMFQYGGKSWQIWNIAMKRALLDTQRIGGCADGSWDPVGKWGMVGGRVYATAINCLTLEVYHRLARAGAEEKKPSEDKKKDSSDEKTKQDK